MLVIEQVPIRGRKVKRMKNKPRLLKTLTAKALVLGLLAMLLLPSTGCDMVPTLPGLASEVPSTVEIISNPVLITEIMTANSATLQSANTTTPDWIELYNSGATDIDLAGYSLSDNLKKPNEWVFPSVTIKAGGYLVVFASGLTATETAPTGELHTSFRLNADGDDLVFTSPTSQILGHIQLPVLPSDISYGMAPGATAAQAPYFYYGLPTPGAANGTDGQTDVAAAIPHPKYGLVVNEYMTNNLSFPDVDGDLPDWVEILNTGTEAIDLLGFKLSDNSDQLDKFVFPDISIAVGQTLVVWLSGKEVTYDPAVPMSLQAAFKFGDGDTTLLMTDSRGIVIIREALEDLPDNVAKGRKIDAVDTWQYYPQPTPGSPNTTAGFTKISGAITLKNRGVWINEVLAESSIRAQSGKVNNPDWIELYNGSAAAISLAGYGLSDDITVPFKMTLSDLTIAPGQYLVVEPTTFGISTNDETIYLTAPNQLLTDWFDTGNITNGISSGRGNAGGSEPADNRFFYAAPTRGAANTTAACQGIALKPTITVIRVSDQTVVDGLYLDGQTVAVTLSSDQAGAAIRYTLDGSTPTSNSALYTAPLSISSNVVIRCRAELVGSLPSDDASRTLLADVRHALPVMSIALDPAAFTGSKGFWANTARGIESAAELNFYETDGTLGVNFAAGMGLHGSFSRKELQKSMEINCRTTYGDAQVIYPFFPDSKVSTFKHLILRTSGQDWKNTKLRDAFMSEVIEDDLETDTMDWRPCVVYINGEYFGLYEIRENIDQYYMAAHFGVDPDNTTIIKGNGIMIEGSKSNYQPLIDYVKSHSMNDPTAYAYVLSQIDELSLMDWIIAETFFNNLDSGNKKFYRENVDGAEWRWAFFDLDWAMYPSTYQKNILSGDLLDPAGHGQGNWFSSALQVKLLENPAFKTAFIERYAYLLNTTFQTDRMLGILDSMTEQIRAEMPLQIARWGLPSSVANWERNVATLRRITTEKRGRMLLILQESFGLSAARMKELFPEDY